MCLHQPAVTAFAERLQPRHLLGVPNRLGEVTRTERGIPHALDGAHEDLVQVPSLFLYPGTVLAGEEDSPGKRRSSSRLSLRFDEVANCQLGLGALERLERRVHVDPRARGQAQLVTAEGALESGRAVDAALLEERAELGHQHSERLLPGRGKLLVPEQVGKLVAGHGTPVLGSQVGEDDPTLPAREALLVHAGSVRLDRETVRQ